MNEHQKKSAGVYILPALMLFQGLSGIFGGIGLVLDPSGQSLRIPLNWLEHSPFSDYLLPGWILLIVLGVFPMAVFFGLWFRRSRAWIASLIVGAALLIWIAVEILIIGYHAQPPLQLIYGLVGIGILATALLPSVRGFYRH